MSSAAMNGALGAAAFTAGAARAPSLASAASSTGTPPVSSAAAVAASSWASSAVVASTASTSPTASTALAVSSTSPRPAPPSAISSGPPTTRPAASAPAPASYIYLTTFPADFPVGTAQAAAASRGRGYLFTRAPLLDDLATFGLALAALAVLAAAMILGAPRGAGSVDSVLREEITWGERAGMLGRDGGAGLPGPVGARRERRSGPGERHAPRAMH